jgi:hypothetical protein
MRRWGRLPAKSAGRASTYSPPRVRIPRTSLGKSAKTRCIDHAQRRSSACTVYHISRGYLAGCGMGEPAHRRVILCPKRDSVRVYYFNERSFVGVLDAASVSCTGGRFLQTGCDMSARRALACQDTGQQALQVTGQANLSILGQRLRQTKDTVKSPRSRLYSAFHSGLLMREISAWLA